MRRRAPANTFFSCAPVPGVAVSSQVASDNSRRNDDLDSLVPRVPGDHQYGLPANMRAAPAASAGSGPQLPSASGPGSQV